MSETTNEQPAAPMPYIAPSYSAAMDRLQSAVHGWEEVEQKLMPAAAKGIEIPDLHNKIRGAQLTLASALDGANTALVKTSEQQQHPGYGGTEENPEPNLFGQAMSYFARTMSTYNGIVIGVHFGRAQLMERNDLFEYTLRSAYHLQQKAVERLEALKSAAEARGQS